MQVNGAVNADIAPRLFEEVAQLMKFDPVKWVFFKEYFLVTDFISINI